MRQFRNGLAIAIAALLLTTAMAPLALAKDDDGPAGLRKMIAVVEFEDKSDRSRWRWTGPNPGIGMSDMLTTELVKSGKFMVMEREQLHHVLAEQDLGQSGRVTEQTAPQVGKLLGVAAVVYGSVTEFGYSAADWEVKKGGFGGLGVSKTTARAAIDVRMIDTTTGEIILADTASDEKSQMGLKVSKDDLAVAFDGKFDETLVGKATRESIEKLVEMITKSLKDVPWTGRVVKASAGKIYLNAGQTVGITQGMEFKVYRPGEELIDPATGLSLGAEEEYVGKISASEIKEKYSICAAVEGSGFEAGDMVRYE